jgi:hypothetical protein
MDNKAVVQSVMDAVQSGNFTGAKALLTEDFKFSGPVPQPIGGPAWLGMSANLRKAFPDLNYRFKVEGEQGAAVDLSAQLSGTHTGDLDLTALGMPVFPPTGKSFAAAYERGTATVQNGKVASWATQRTEGAGLVAILKQLGLPTPG